MQVLNISTSELYLKFEIMEMIKSGARKIALFLSKTRAREHNDPEEVLKVQVVELHTL